jgi:poly(hydroxyalkanoate) depolymerase family esterase
VNDQMRVGMEEATRLTREGRLSEATAVIQRTLGGSAVPATDDAGGADGSIKAISPVASEGQPPTSPSQASPTERTLRQTPRPPRSFRGTMPGSLGVGAMPVDRADTRGSAGGRFVERSYTNRFGTRAYKLYIPSGYIGQAVPLIVMLHGCTQSPDDLATGTRMNLLAEEHTFLVAYPAQAAAANSSRCWNWFEAADQQRGRGEPSLIAGITCEVVGEYHVAADRVYVAGMSAGGAMAAIMGATYPDIYAAIGVHSGLAPGAAHDLPSAFSAMRQGQPSTTRRNARTGGSSRTLPAILFHGDRDTTVHPRNGDHLLTHHWTANRGAPDATGGEAPRVRERRGRVSGGYAYTCATYHDANGRAIVERWTVHGLGHAWSGGSLPGSYTDPKGPDASAEMLRFFHEHPLQGEPTGQPIA